MSRSRPNSFTWLTGLLLSSLFVLAFTLLGVMLFVVPKFEKVLDDANVAIPLAAVLLFDVSKWLGGRLPGQMLPGVVYLLIMSLVAVVARAAWSTKTDGVRSNV